MYCYLNLSNRYGAGTGRCLWWLYIITHNLHDLANY